MQIFLKPLFLFILNLTIIVAAFTIGGGMFFYESGLIHLFAVFFGLLSVYALYRFWQYKGAMVFTAVKGSVLALFLFSLGHFSGVLELLHLGGEDVEEIIEFIELLFYAIGFVVIQRAFHKIIGLYRGKGRQLSPAVGLIVSLIITAGAFFLLKGGGADSLLDYQALLPIALVSFSLPMSVLLYFESLKIEKIMSLFKNYMRYSRLSFLFFALAVILELSEIAHIEFLSQAHFSYLSHFVFYIGFSLQLLAVGNLLEVGGAYEDVGKEVAKEKNRIKKYAAA